MIPDEIDLSKGARLEIEAIDERLDEIDEETRALLDRRSEIIEAHAPSDETGDGRT